MAADRKGHTFFTDILAGYGRLFSSILLWAAVAVACLALSAAIVWPLWRLATGWRGIYNILFASFLGLTLAALLASSARRRVASGERLRSVLGSWALACLRLLSFALMVGCVWLALLFFIRPAFAWSIPAGIASSLAALALAGWLFFGRRRS